MKVLMLSSSRVGSESYLEHAIPMINVHLASINELLFIPFAGVSINWDDYTAKVQTALPHLKIIGLHQCTDVKQAIQSAQAIAVGGGNTFNLLHQLYQQDLMTLIQDKVKQNIPYIGWSAGTNICGNSIRTTNDMPIVQPKSFDGLNFIPLQLNPHYTDYRASGHNGETRAERIREFCVLNPTTPVIGIREGCALLLKGNSLVLKGDLSGVVFEGQTEKEISPEQDLSCYL